MGSKKANAQEKLANDAYAKSTAEVANIAPSADAKAVSSDAYGDYQNLRNGDVSKNPMVAAYLQRSGSAKRRAETMSPMGDASLASRIANPTLIAQSRDMLNRQGEQSDAAAVTDIAAEAEGNAVNRIYGYSDQNMSAAGARSSAYRGLSSDAFSRYQAIKQQGSFWSNLAKGALTTAAGAFAGPAGAAGAAAIFGKPK